MPLANSSQVADLIGDGLVHWRQGGFAPKDGRYILALHDDGSGAHIWSYRGGRHGVGWYDQEGYYDGDGDLDLNGRSWCFMPYSFRPYRDSSDQQEKDKTNMHSSEDRVSDHALGYSIKYLAENGPISRSEIYEAMNAGLLRAKKMGRRTIITPDAWRDYLNRLPDYSVASQ